MDLQKLKRFFTVVEYMSITKAAESLYITQPTLSKYISSLEDELGIKLFIRENQTLILTQAGKLLYDQGKTLMEQADSMIASLAFTDTSARPKLNIVLERLHSEQLFHLLRELYEQHSEFEFNSRTITNNFNEITNMVSSGSVEMGVVCRSSVDDLKDDFSMIRIFKDRVALVTSDEHRLAGRKSVHISELKDEDVVCPDCSDNMVELYRRLYSASGHDPETMRFLDKEDQLSRVKWNLSVALCYRDGVGSDLPDCFRVIDLDGADTEFSVILLWRRDDKSPFISTFIDVLEKYFPDYEWLE